MKHPDGMKVYLAGPMRGFEDDNKPLFNFAAKKLRALGYVVYNPGEGEVGKTFREYFKGDLAWICDHAEAIALLPGWEKSMGACAERAVAISLGLQRIILGKEYVQ